MAQMPVLPPCLVKFVNDQFKTVGAHANGS